MAAVATARQGDGQYRSRRTFGSDAFSRATASGSVAEIEQPRMNPVLVGGVGGGGSFSDEGARRLWPESLFGLCRMWAQCLDVGHTRGRFVGAAKDEE